MTHEIAVVHQTTPRITLREMEDSTSSVLLISKIGAMIGLGFGSLALGALPLMVGLYRTKQLKKRRRAVSNHSSTSTSTSASNASSSSVDSPSATNLQVRPRPGTGSSVHVDFVDLRRLRRARLCVNRPCR